MKTENLHTKLVEKLAQKKFEYWKKEFMKKVKELKDEMAVVFDDIKDQEQMEIIIDKIFKEEK